MVRRTDPVPCVTSSSLNTQTRAPVRPLGCGGGAASSRGFVAGSGEHPVAMGWITDWILRSGENTPRPSHDPLTMPQLASVPT